MNLDLSLKENFHQQSVTEILTPIAAQHGISWRSPAKMLEALISEGAVVRPETDITRVRQLTYKLAGGSSLSHGEKTYMAGVYSAMVEGIEGIQEGQVYLLPMTFQGIVLIPPNYRTSTRFRKWGDLIRLERFKTVKEAEEKKARPANLIREAFRQAGLQEFYTGYNFAGIRAGEGSTFNRILLEDCIDAAMMFSYCSSPGRAEKSAEINIKQNHQLAMAAIETGGLYVVEVPSVDKEEVQRYRIVLKSVPITDSRTNDTSYSTWFNLNAEHACMIGEESANTRRYRRGSRDLCKHVLAALLYLGWCLKGSGEQYEIAFIPNVVPTQSQYEYAMKLRHFVIAETEVNGHIYHNPLTKIQREVLEWKRAALRGFDETFAARRGFQNYILGSPQALRGL